MAKINKPIDIICMDCGITFVAHSCKALRCEKCKKIAKNQAAKDCVKRNRRIHSTDTYKPPKMSMSETLMAMEEYNKEHKTHLTYGQFVSLMEGGKSNGKRKRR